MAAGSTARSRDRQKAFEYYDFSLLAVVIVLSIFGLIMLYSTTAYSSQMASGDDMAYLKKQAEERTLEEENRLRQIDCDEFGMDRKPLKKSDIQQEKKAEQAKE